MNHYKKTQKKYEKLRGIYFQIGLIISGGLVLLAFEWTSPVNIHDLGGTIIYEEEWDPPVDAFDIIPDEEQKKEEIEEKTSASESHSDQFDAVDDDYKEKEEEEKKEDDKSDLVFDDKEWEEPEKKKTKKGKPTPPAPPVFVATNMPHYKDCESLDEVERKKCTQDKMYEHFGNSIRIPETIKMLGKAEYKAFVYFEVNRKGEIANVKILNTDKNRIPKELERQAYNAVKTLPQLIPGRNHGKKVSVRYSIPINFTVL